MIDAGLTRTSIEIEIEDSPFALSFTVSSSTARPDMSSLAQIASRAASPLLGLMPSNVVMFSGAETRDQASFDLGRMIVSAAPGQIRLSGNPGSLVASRTFHSETLVASENNGRITSDRGTVFVEMKPGQITLSRLLESREMAPGFSSVRSVIGARLGPEFGLFGPRPLFPGLMRGPQGFDAATPRPGAPSPVPVPLAATGAEKPVATLANVHSRDAELSRLVINVAAQSVISPLGSIAILSPGTPLTHPRPLPVPGVDPSSPQISSTSIADEPLASSGFLETVLPIGSGLITVLSPFDPDGTLHVALSRLVDEVDDLGISLPASTDDLTVIVPIGVAVIALEGARRWRKRRTLSPHARSWPSRSLLFSRFS